jgi:hypothetical protein
MQHFGAGGVKPDAAERFADSGNDEHAAGQQRELIPVAERPQRN